MKIYNIDFSIHIFIFSENNSATFSTIVFCIIVPV